MLSTPGKRGGRLSYQGNDEKSQNVTCGKHTGTIPRTSLCLSDEQCPQFSPHAALPNPRAKGIITELRKLKSHFSEILTGH